jgi:exosortase A-associated hydrolase 2
MSAVRTTGCFIDGAEGRILLVARQPAGEARDCVLVVPPFAEELNKCRRMITEAAHELAVRGIASVLPDLHGTGDSDGDFADARWSTWIRDLSLAAHWCRDAGMPVSGVLAIRLGATLAAAALDSGDLAPVPVSVLWQPVFDGRRHMAQFLRQRIAMSRLQLDRAESMEEIRARLVAGEIVEVAGYGLARGLVEAIEGQSLPVHGSRFGAITWMELLQGGTALPLPSSAAVRALGEQGCDVRTMTFTGEPYWAATEIAVNTAIVAATVESFAGQGGQATPRGRDA